MVDVRWEALDGTAGEQTSRVLQGGRSRGRTHGWTDLKPTLEAESLGITVRSSVGGGWKWALGVGCRSAHSCGTWRVSKGVLDELENPHPSPFSEQNMKTQGHSPTA